MSFDSRFGSPNRNFGNEDANEFSKDTDFAFPSYGPNQNESRFRSDNEYPPRTFLPARGFRSSRRAFEQRPYASFGRGGRISKPKRHQAVNRRGARPGYYGYRPNDGYPSPERKDVTNNQPSVTSPGSSSGFDGEYSYRGSDYAHKLSQRKFSQSSPAHINSGNIQSLSEFLSDNSYGFFQSDANAYRPLATPPRSFPKKPRIESYSENLYQAEVTSVLHDMKNEVDDLQADLDHGEHYKNDVQTFNNEVTNPENSCNPEWIELDEEKVIKIVKNVLIPVKRYPGFNFVGKLLGPKGARLRNIADTFHCSLKIMGKGSTRDRNNELRLLASGNPSYAHFDSPLHVRIETEGASAIAYQNLSGVLGALTSLLEPDSNSYLPRTENTEDDMVYGYEPESRFSKEKPAMEEDDQVMTHSTIGTKEHEVTGGEDADLTEKHLEEKKNTEAEDNQQLSDMEMKNMKEDKKEMERNMSEVNTFPGNLETRDTPAPRRSARIQKLGSANSHLH